MENKTQATKSFGERERDQARLRDFNEMARRMSANSNRRQADAPTEPAPSVRLPARSAFAR